MSDSAVKCLSDCALVFQLCGHQYFSVASLFDEKQKKRPTIRYILLFFISVFIQSSQMGALATWEHSDEALSAKNILTIVVRYAMYFGVVFIISISLIQSFMATAALKKFYWNCIKIARMFDVKCNVSIDHRHIKKRLIRRLIFFVLFFTVLEGCVYCFEMLFGMKLRPFLKIAAGFTPTAFLATIIFKFTFFVQMINLHLATYDKALKKLFEPFKTQKLISVINGIVVKPANVNEKEVMRMRFQNLRNVYFVITENAEIVNHSMGATILVVIVVMVISITSIIYKFCMVLLHNAPVHRVVSK